MKRVISPRHIEMCEGPILPNLIPYAIPLILSGVLQLLFNAADMVVVGRFCGSTSVGAVGATGSLINLLVNMFMGLSTGSGVAVAMSIGKGDREQTHRTVHTAMLLACIAGAVISVLGIFLTRPLLVLMATPADVLDLAATYVRIYFFGSIPNALYNFGAAIMRANGDTKRPMTYLTIAGVVNVVLNVLFVTAAKMDVAGVALATAISQVVSAVLVIHALMAQHDSTRLEIAHLRLYRKEMKTILKIGLPAALQGSTFSISNMLIQGSINSFGTAAVAGIAAASNILNFSYTAMNSLRHATLNFVGQNYGAGKPDRVRRVVLNSVLCVSVVGIVLGLLSYVFAEPLLHLYITDSAEAVRFGTHRLLWFGLCYFICGIMEVFMGALQGLGRSAVSMCINVFFTCFIRIVWVLTVFAAIPTLNALYASYPISWGAAVVAEAIAFVFIMKHTKKKPTEETN